MKQLNVGCGNVFHEEWVNIDIAPYSREVKSWDLRTGLPFHDASFDVVYHSHLLEHLQPIAAYSLMQECFRVLKPNGIIRVVVPDLESIVRDYLYALEQVEEGFQSAEENYDWMMLELYDQTTRLSRGGEMIRFLERSNLSNKDFIISRVGHEVKLVWEQSNDEVYRKKIWKKMKSQSFFWYVQQVRNLIAETLIYVTAGQESRKAFREGLFRRSGEVHQWMYDRFSLKRLLKDLGFTEVKICNADESRISGFNRYNLDMVEGQIRKPDSLFVEAVKPLAKL
jgi:predicted SAM-dependent methyltransferase